MSRVITIAAGGGLSLGGTQVYCGDFIFSGHTLVLMMSFFVIRECKYQEQLLIYHEHTLLQIHLAQENLSCSTLCP